MNNLRLQSDLSAALEHGELFAYFQPQQELATGRIVAVEALCRWQHPVLGALSPELFIPMAEEAGSIHEIGMFMLEEGCRAADRWQRLDRDLQVSVNVSVAQLESEAFVERVIELVDELQLRPGALTVEVTESLEILDLLPVIDRLNQLRRNGVGVSIDDYGAGYTSLEQINELPVSELKLDQRLVHNDSGPLAEQLSSLVAEVHARGIRVVAEGVETFADLDRARDLACDRAQGYLIGMPMARDDLEVLLRR